MEYAVKPLTSEDAEYMEEKMDGSDDVILPPEPDAPEDLSFEKQHVMKKNWVIAYKLWMLMGLLPVPTLFTCSPPGYLWMRQL